MVLQLKTNCEIKYEWMNAQLMSLLKYPMSDSQNTNLKKKSVKNSKIAKNCYIIVKTPFYNSKKLTCRKRYKNAIL